MGRVYVFGLDGMPYSLWKFLQEKNIIPNTSFILKNYQVQNIKSVIPVISSVAWTSFATGKDPSFHGIYGFVDKENNPFGMKILLSRDIKEKAIWEKAGENNKRVAVINVPITYPTYDVNGVLVSCFLCPDVEKAVYPPTMKGILSKHGYIIDSDTSLAAQSKKLFLQNLNTVLENRFKVAQEIFQMEKWDYFHLHVMETDRLMHFLWDDIFDCSSPYQEEIFSFFSKLDRLLAKMLLQIPNDDTVVILSDHGFTGIKYEVQVNTWLRDMGLLKTRTNSIHSITEDSVCYSLLPGRIYINLKGREEKGFIEERSYKTVCQQIISKLEGLICPETGEKVIDKVFLRDEIYSGPYASDSADITILPKDGYDLKASLDSSDVFTKSSLTGMHTYENAILCSKNLDISRINNITEIASPLLKKLLEV